MDHLNISHMTNQVHRSISLSNMPLTTMGGGDGVHHYFGKGKGHRFRRGVKEIRQPLMRWKGGEGDKVQLGSSDHTALYYHKGDNNG